MTYQPPVKDHLFLLRDVLEIDKHANLPGFADASIDVVEQILEEAARFTSEVLAPLNSVGDKEGCTWHPDNTVTTPKGFKEAYAQLVEGGWPALGADPNYGGQGLPHVVNLAFSEMSSSANMAFSMYPGLTHGAYSAIHVGGTDEQKSLYLPNLASGKWGGTMNLTEPHCGTDLGLLRTKAVPQPDGTYKLTGQKIWISGGEHDMAENIIHLVLARIEGAPMGTRGGIVVTHIFPADGEYTIGVNLHNEPLGGLYGRSTMSVMNINEEIDVAIDGQRVAVIPLNQRMSESDPKNSLDPKTARIHVTAGPHRVSAAFIQKFEAPIDDSLMPTENTLADVSMSFGVTLLPHLRDMTVNGPYAVTGVSDSVSRRRIFSCRPTSAAEEPACANEIIKSLAAQAFRGPVPQADLDTLKGFYEEGRKAGDFEHAIRYTLQAILASPRFVFRLEEVPAATRAGASYRLNDQDVASRLSFFLWGTVPDQELTKAAAAGQLRTAASLRKQVDRMIADPRSEALATRFASQWLRLQDLDKMVPDYLQYPHYDDTLAAGFKRETELFVDSLIRENRSLLELIDSDYTFVNERVAVHYGIPNVTGNEFRRVPVTDVNRRGILGHGSILALTSIADRTSPVLRGKYVMEVLLGAPPPAPPPNVPGLDETKDTNGGRTLSVRERMEQHRKNPPCINCHRVIDPLGLALENFDVTGAWRIKDNEVGVDPVGDLYDGTKLDGPVGLRKALLRHKDAVLLSFTEHLMTYALGRRVEAYDMPLVRQIIRDAAANGYKMQTFVQGVVASQAFRMSRVEAPETTTTAPAAAGNHR